MAKIIDYKFAPGGTRAVTLSAPSYSSEEGLSEGLAMAFALGSVYQQRYKDVYEEYSFALERGAEYLMAASAIASAHAGVEAARREAARLGGRAKLAEALPELEEAGAAFEREVSDVVNSARAAWRALARQAFPSIKVGAGAGAAEVVAAVRSCDPALCDLPLPDLARALQKRAQPAVLVSAARPCRRGYESLLDRRVEPPAPNSPLRYMGGKSRAVDLFLSLIPADTETLCSPFFGGGSVELAAARRGVRVSGYDCFEPLTNFWRHALSDAPGLARRARTYYPLGREEFYSLQRRYNEIESAEERAAAFYVLNRASFGGGTLSSGMASGADTRFTPGAIDRLRQFRAEGVTVESGDFAETIWRHRDDDFLFLDPPYLIDSFLYGVRGDAHKDFDHGALWDLLVELRDRRWVLCYNDGPLARDLYAVFETFNPVWSYGMGRDKSSRELLVVSDALAGRLEDWRVREAA